MPENDEGNDTIQVPLTCGEILVRSGTLMIGGVAGGRLGMNLAEQIRMGTETPVGVGLFVLDIALVTAVLLDSIRRMPSPDDYDP